MQVVEIPLAATADLRRRVLRSHRPGLPVTNPEDDRRGTFHLGVVDDGGAVLAVGSFSPQPCDAAPGRRAVRLRGMAVEPSLQGRGLGALLLRAAVDRLRADGVEVLWAHARDTALAFYVREGFTPVGASFDEIGIPHTTVVRDLLL